MSDLTVVAMLKAKPGSEGAVRDALSALVEPTRAEDGCISYDLFDSMADAATFVTVEKWRSQDDLNAHMDTDHVKGAFAVAGEHLAAAPEIHPLSPVA